MIFLIPLFAAISPFILWPIETFLPYPFLIEELVKGLLVYNILKLPQSLQLKTIFLSGALFALSEGVLYLFNILLVGNLPVFIIRLAVTSSLHILTFLTIYAFSYKSSRLIFIGIGAAAAIHYLFNSFAY